ncbi:MULTISPECIES: hypothetical protein [Burkholderiaceae]|uniref:hypothetical protein n=1 Tax=Burkholderiaceae TaxID=119060 RepID=UPI00161771C1|nr:MULTISPECIES: hypothetical protein [Burkholderiaceae]MBB2981379.1 hypothetical protein [Paraburkholderia tropica]MCA8147199.1 hypothetical protein [Burkholderia vietnamiensis]
MNLNNRYVASKPSHQRASLTDDGMFPDEISWRSKVLDAIGRSLFGSTRALGVREGFYHVAAERSQRNGLRANVRDQLIRRDIRVWLSRRMLVVGAVLIIVSFLLNDRYTQALATSAQHFIH